MAIEIDTVSKLLDLLERVRNLDSKSTITPELATRAEYKITEALELIFPPIPPPE